MVDFWVVHSIRAESSTLEIKYAYADEYVTEKYAEADTEKYVDTVVTLTSGL